MIKDCDDGFLFKMGQQFLWKGWGNYELLLELLNLM
jgi:hypothetical protein